MSLLTKYAAKEQELNRLKEELERLESDPRLKAELDGAGGGDADRQLGVIGARLAGQRPQGIALDGDARRYAQATRVPKAFGAITLAKTRPLATRLYLYRCPSRGRKDRNKNGQASRAARSRKAAKGHREPWVLVSNLSPRHGIAKKVVDIYAKRMAERTGCSDSCAKKRRDRPVASSWEGLRVGLHIRPK